MIMYALRTGNYPSEGALYPQQIEFHQKIHGNLRGGHNPVSHQSHVFLPAVYEKARETAEEIRKLSIPMPDNLIREIDPTIIVASEITDVICHESSHFLDGFRKSSIFNIGTRLPYRLQPEERRARKLAQTALKPIIRQKRSRYFQHTP